MDHSSLLIISKFLPEHQIRISIHYILWNIHGDQSWWIVKILLICEDVISFVTGLLHHNIGQYITLLNISGDIN